MESFSGQLQRPNRPTGALFGDLFWPASLGKRQFLRASRPKGPFWTPCLASFSGQTAQKLLLRPVLPSVRGQTGQKGLFGDLFWRARGANSPKKAGFETCFDWLEPFWRLLASFVGKQLKKGFLDLFKGQAGQQGPFWRPFLACFRGQTAVFEGQQAKKGFSGDLFWQF